MMHEDPSYVMAGLFCVQWKDLFHRRGRGVRRDGLIPYYRLKVLLLTERSVNDKVVALTR